MYNLIAQQLRALIALPEEPGSVPSTTEQLTTSCDSSSEGADPIFQPLWALGTHGYIYKQTKHLYTLKRKISLRT